MIKLTKLTNNYLRDNIAFIINNVIILKISYVFFFFFELDHFLKINN